MLAGVMGRDLREGFEEKVQALAGDSDSVVLHLHLDNGPVARGSLEGDAHVSLAPRLPCELYSVVAEVDKALTQLERVAHQHQLLPLLVSMVAGNLDGKVHLPSRHPRAHHVTNVVANLLQEEGLQSFRCLLLPGGLEEFGFRVQLGKVQDLVYDTEKRFGGSQGRGHVLCLCGAQVVGLEEQGVEGDDRVQGCAQLMADVGEEARGETSRGLGLYHRHLHGMIHHLGAHNLAVSCVLLRLQLLQPKFCHGVEEEEVSSDERNGVNRLRRQVHKGLGDIILSESDGP
mmetsp:Transcript_48079/g.150862  ORF Transcript_48079/g.150862 Transcript_48079/m.150862 type:complete len:287 (+) Transcript_48079:1117-1977(+)